MATVCSVHEKVQFCKGAMFDLICKCFVLFGLLTVLGLHCGVQGLVQLWRVDFSLVPRGLLIVVCGLF